MKNTRSNTNKNNQQKKPGSLVPSFWLYLGIIAILSCLGFYSYRYWQLSSSTSQSDSQTLKPSKYSGKINADSEVITREELSPEDLSIAADLDNIDVILQEMEQNTNPQSYIPVKSISKQKKNGTTSTKSVDKNQRNSDVKSLQTDLNKKTETSSLDQTIDNSSLQKVIEPSSITTQIGLDSNNQNKIIKNNLNNSESETDRERGFRLEGRDGRGVDTSSQNSLGRIYNRERNSLTTNSETTARNNTSQLQRSPYKVEPQVTSFTPDLSSPTVNVVQRSPRSLSDYQIQPQDYNLLVPGNYSALPTTNSQPTQTPNNISSPTVPLNNSSSYQLPLQELNQFNSNNKLNTPNTTNLSQPNSYSSTSGSIVNNSGLQPSGILQPSGSLIIK
jgi:hypothetical protein